jgi:hypothetical protein
MPLHRVQPDLHLLPYGILQPFQFRDPGLAIPVIVKHEVEVVCDKVLELFLVPHLDIAVPDKTLDGDEMLFLKGKVRLFQLVEEPDRVELL